MKILVIGDYISDVYTFGTATRLCPESPVPVVVPEVERKSHGGAGLVHAQLGALGANVDCCWRSYSEKHRYFAGNHLVCRIDRDSMPSQYNHTWEPDLTADAFVVSDYGKGAMTRELAKQIRDTGKWCFIDAKHHWEWYEGCVGWAFPNELEAEQLKCLDRCIVKLGARGCKMGALELLATVSEVVDVTGAGDIFMASFVYAWSIQLPAEDCLRFANELAGESCRHRGTYVVPRGFAQSVLDRLRASRASEQQARGSSLDSNGSNFRQPSAQDQIAQPAYEASSDSPLLRWYEETAGSATAVDILQPAQTPRQSPSVPTGSSDAQTQEGQGIQGVAGSESRSAGYTPNPTSTERQCGHTQEPGQGPTE